MPGIIGCSLTGKWSAVTKMVTDLYKTQYLNEYSYKDANLYVLSLERNTLIHAHNDIFLAFEGYCINNSKKGLDLLKCLADSYSNNGLSFINDIRGSFQIVIHDTRNDSTLLFTDHTGSRPIFYAIQNDILYFSPEIISLLNVIDNLQIDQVSLASFIVSGFFPSGRTLFKQIKLLSPGEAAIFKNNQISIDRFYNFNFDTVTDQSFPYLVDLLNQQIEKTIHEYWKHAINPGILLSGGIDSQIIFYNIADYVSDTTQLTTITWGQNNGLKDTDIDVALKTAKRFGTKHIIVDKTTKNYDLDFIEMFPAQSGMTDTSFVHANELSVVKYLREKHDIFSLFRGDQCFGRNNKVYTTQNMLLKLNMSFPDYITDFDKFFSTHHQIKKKYDKFIHNTLRKHHKNNLYDTEDILFFYNRLAMYLQFCNYFKYHFQQIYNPLLDKNILDLLMTIPFKYRGDKLLIKNCLLKKFGSKHNIKFSQNNNMIDWENEISDNTELKQYLYNRIYRLPKSLNLSYFHGLLSKKKESKISIGKRLLYALPYPIFNTLKSIRTYLFRFRSNFLYTPSVHFVFRALIISRWYNILLKRFDSRLN